MTFYRADVQYRIPWTESPLGNYYCTHVYYFNAADASELDLMKDACFRATANSLNVSSRLDRCLFREWPSGVVNQSSSASWPPNGLLTGVPGPLTNTVYLSLLHDGVQVGFKRLRSPLRPEDIEGDFLTDAAVTYYASSVGGVIVDAGGFTNAQGVSINGVKVNPRVCGWQLRHGTKRRLYRRLHA